MNGITAMNKTLKAGQVFTWRNTCETVNSRTGLAEAPSAYNNGLHIAITDEVGNFVESVKFIVGDGYTASNRVQFDTRNGLIEIIPTDTTEVQAFISFLTNFSKAPMRGDKLAWIESVYSRAGEIARLITYNVNKGLPVPMKRRLEGDDLKAATKVFIAAIENDDDPGEVLELFFEKVGM
jgi:hypothetical protein